MHSLLCPPVSAYAAIQVDPAAMVAHLYARALEEVQEIRPKTYLILTSFGMSFPFPGHPWSVYSVWPVGPSLRAVDEKRGFEPDMCVPIFPNEAHPTGRVPVHPTSPFPYNNCYHWAGMRMGLRVHVREEGFDNTRAIRLPAGDIVDMSSLFSLDRGRGTGARLAREEAASAAPHHASIPDHSPPSTGDQPKDATACDEVDIFTPPKHSQDPEYVPLVHLWLDLPANLKQEDIGNPVDLYRERYVIMSIIRRAHERNADLPTLGEYIALHHGPYIGDSDSESYMSGTISEYVSEEFEAGPYGGEEQARKPRHFRPAKFSRKLRARASKFFTVLRVRLSSSRSNSNV